MVTGEGTWVQAKLPDGREVGGKIVLAEYQGYRFGTREFVQTNPDGSIPLINDEVPRHLMQLELAVEDNTPDDVVEEITTAVESTDPLRRLAVPYLSTPLVDWMEKRTTRLWKARSWFTRSVLGRDPISKE